MGKKSSIDVLLSSFNGDRYLVEQIESILGQSFKDFKLIIRDDGSSDGTVAILKEFSERNPGKVRYICGENIGVSRSYHELMKMSESPYVAFADQDDVWDLCKLENLRNDLMAAECGLLNKPVLVHSDLRVVNEIRGIISKSFWELSGIKPDENSLNKLFAKNTVTGCAMMVNRAAIDLAIKVEPKYDLHDYFMALLVSMCGEVKYTPAALIDYRQHQFNVVGARRRSFFDLFFKRNGFESVVVRRDNERLIAIERYAKSLLELKAWVFINDKDIQMLNGLAGISEMRYIARLFFLLRHKIFTGDLIGNYSLWLKK